MSWWTYYYYLYIFLVPFAYLSVTYRQHVDGASEAAATVSLYGSSQVITKARLHTTSVC
jgi:hypothetical protein